MALLFLSSAFRHGIAQEDMIHALRNSICEWVLNESMVMLVGPARDSTLLEVGLVEWHGDVAVVHAMIARKEFLRS